jgi:hypothetical protein
MADDAGCAGRTTGIICHGPIVLLSTLSDSEAFQKES